LKEYPHTRKDFKVNGKTFQMRKLTLGLQADIEDENITVTYVDVLKNSTTMEESDLRALDSEQLDAIYADIVDFTYTKSSGDGEPKKPSS